MDVTGYSEASVPEQGGKAFLVSGANTGIGFETARVLAARGARVYLGCRSAEKGQVARQRIVELHPEADLVQLDLDLASMASIHAAADYMKQQPRLDVLINNAGVMMPPMSFTEDGFESQFGVNHLGHFALTGLLLPMLQRIEGSRVVAVSSVVHRRGEIDLDDPNAQASYSRSKRYSMSKLANLMFAFEMDRRLRRRNSNTMALACHPGVADTELSRFVSQNLVRVMRPLVGGWLNSAAEGALPSLRAATAPDAKGGDYYGPTKRRETARGADHAKPAGRSQNQALAKQLWDLSVEMTGIDPLPQTIPHPPSG